MKPIDARKDVVITLIQRNKPQPFLRSVGDDATSYHGNQQRHVIVIPKPDDVVHS